MLWVGEIFKGRKIKLFKLKFIIMKLSKIINQFNKDQRLHSITIEVRPQYSVCTIYREGVKNYSLKVYRNINVDIDIPEINNRTVKHLGIKKYFYLVTEQYYIKLYYY